MHSQFEINRDTVDPTFIGGFVTRWITDSMGFYRRTVYYRAYKNKI